MTKVIGITGGIGSGKSTFVKYLKEQAFNIHDSDYEVQKIYKEPTNKLLQHLKKIGLQESIKKNNKIDKKIIAKIIFTNNNTKKELENFIFKIVRDKRNLFIKKFKNKKNKFIFIDVPLLFENDLDNIFYKIISIVANKSIRYQRLKKNKKMSKEMFENILKSQTSDMVRKQRSDIVIYNNLTLEKFRYKAIKTIKDNFI